MFADFAGVGFAYPLGPNDDRPSGHAGAGDPCDGASIVPALVTVQTAGPEQFIVRVVDQPLLDEMIAICNGQEPQKIVNGDLLTGNLGYNHDPLNGTGWSWHLDDTTLELAEIAMELCDGVPSFVEGSLFYWLLTVGSYCPWSSQIVAINADTTMAGDFDVDSDVDGDDFALLTSCIGEPGATCYGGDGVRRADDADRDVGCCAADMDTDADVDCDDWELFKQAWTEPGPPPYLPYCDRPVPAASGWGMTILALSALAAGTLLYRRGPGTGPSCRQDRARQQAVRSSA
jgi:hypothetical protein